MSDLEQRAVNLRDRLKEHLAEAKAIKAELGKECSPRTFDVQGLVTGLTQAHGAAFSLAVNANREHDHLVTIFCCSYPGPTATTLEMTPA